MIDFSNGLSEFIVIAGVISATTYGYFLLTRRSAVFKWGLTLLSIISAAYLSFDPWVFGALFLVTIYLAVPRNDEAAQVGYFLLMLAIFPVTYRWLVPFPGANYLIALSHSRILAMVLLLPIAFRQIYRSGFRSYPSFFDAMVFAYFFLTVILGFREVSITEGVRQAFLRVVDYFLIYMVVSRIAISSTNLRKIFQPSLFVATVLVGIGVIEHLKNWHFYFRVTSFADVPTQELFGGGYLEGMIREGSLRVFASMFQPIAFGFYLTLHVCFSFLLSRLTARPLKIYLLILPLYFTLGVFLTISRTPVLGIACFFVVLVAVSLVGRWGSFFRRSMRLAPAIVIFGLVFLMTPTGRSFMAILPGFEQGFDSSIAYRIRLLDASLDYIASASIFGDPNFSESPKLLLPSGHLKLDVTNSFLQCLLAYGIVGGGVYFTTLYVMIYSLVKRMNQRKTPLVRLYGRILISLSCALLIMLFGVSSISLIPLFTFLIFGLVSAYLRIEEEKFADQEVSSYSRNFDDQKVALVREAALPQNT